MGKVHFPLVNIRKDIMSRWKMKHFTGSDVEEITVPEAPNSDGFYTAFLKEIPDPGTHTASVTTTSPKISGLTELRSEPIDSKTLRLKLTPVQFYVNYQTGEILFHPSVAGKTFKCDYYGRGSLVEADDINYLYDKIMSLSHEYELAEFNSFEIEGYDNTIFEVGETFPSESKLTFKWEILNPGNVKTNSITIENTTNDTVLGTKLENTGEYVFNMTDTITCSKPESLNFRISAARLNGDIISKEINFIWVDRIFWGTSPTKKINSEQIKNFPDNMLFDSTAENQKVTLSFNEEPNSYKVIVVPQRYKANKIIDKLTSLEFVMDEPTSVHITNSLKLQVPYYIYCSTYPIAPALSLILQLGETDGN